MLAQLDTSPKTTARALVEKMVPVLQPAENPPGPRVFRPLFVGHESSPINVFYAQTTPNQQNYLMTDVFAEAGMSQSRLEAICLNNWWATHKDLVWETFEGQNGNTPILSARSNSYVLSTILLSHGHLKGMHKHFGEDLVFLGVPDRFTVLAHSDSQALSAQVERIYKDAFRSGTELSPHVFVSRNGHVVGYEERNQANAEQNGESEEELLLAIQKVFCYAFLMISIADKEQDVDEIAKFADALDSTAGQGMTIVHHACSKMPENDFAILEDVLQSGAERAPMLMLDCIRSLKKNLPGSEFDILRTTTLKIGRAVAASEQTGGAELKISKNKQDALDILAGLFNIA